MSDDKAPSVEPAPPLDLKNPSIADLERLRAADPAEYERIIHGRRPHPVGSVADRLTGKGRRK